jgi:hypothetical protein
MNIPPYFYVELLSLLVGICSYSKLSVWFKRLAVFLGFIVLVELSGLLIVQKLGRSNHFLFNLSVPISIIFYSCLFRSLFLSTKNRRIVTVGLIVFVSFSILNMIFLQGVYFFNSYTIMLGSVWIVFLSCLLLLQLSDLIELGGSILKMPQFWLAGGLLFSFSGSLLYWVIFNIQDDSYDLYFNWMIKSQIYIRYLCFAICFLCFYKNNPSLSTSA